MGIEIERKFKVKDTSFLKGLKGISIKQGYLYIGDKSVSRVRIIENKKAYLTVKGRTGDISRLEFEYEIPLKDGIELLENVCLKPLIEKVRYKLPVGNHVWEIDVFEGENKGLIIAEIELESEDEEFEKPDWAGEDVSNDERYYNYSLVKFPYSVWDKKG
ncbi:adenylate cyclase [Thermotomaculum hydrothermale]|uniref:Adenylate cyclase n=1 Tax=Thermotomaculum hydrothermale TaxID=981385 RepID=A0A7R6PV63_9BACT|nr:CYTH domain-containing protein [Thermotomaculum hydrothermale]BBB33297.1 adenylate cyclase [Thermotomaculum hydrothermale]